MRALGRLLRLSLAPSAAADIACGIMLGGLGWPSGARPWFLMLASLAVYHGGMALNDWADRELDRVERKDRPIPSAAVPAPAALVIALAGLFGGPLIAVQVSLSAGMWMSVVALLALTYDLVGRGALRGPLLLAACRAGNLAVGVFAFSDPLQPRPVGVWSVCLLYGAYVFFVSRLGRLEDGEASDSGRAAGWLVKMAVCLGAIGALPILGLAWPGRLLALAISWSGAWALLRLARETRTWTKPKVLAAMGVALRRLLVFTAAATALAWNPPHHAALVVVAAVFCGYPVSFWLRKVFPPS
jgi:4-hydroxybenzoate polyprenyltransferase